MVCIPKQGGGLLESRWQVIVGLVLMILFEFFNWLMGGALDKFTFFVMPLVLLAVVYFLVTGELARFERRFSGILRNHLREERFVNDANRLRVEMIAAVRKADKFIMTTGGRARDEEYLSAIEKKVLAPGDLEYWRVILGDHIHHGLHIHLVKLYNYNNVHIRWHKEEILGNILVTEDQVILPLASPTPGAFKSALILPSIQIVQNYKEFVLKVFGEAEELSLQDLGALCIECRAEKERKSSNV